MSGLTGGTTYIYLLRTDCPSGLTPVGPVNTFMTQAPPRLAAAGGMDELTVDLFPNPTNGLMNVVVNSMSLSTAVIEVYNMLGQKVFGWEGEIEETTIRQIDLSNEMEGQYLVKVTSQGKVATKLVNLTK